MKPIRECRYPDQSTLLQRLWAVMSDPHCEQQEERQLLLLEAFLSMAEERIKMQDVQLVTNVMSFIAKKAELQSKYRQYFQKFLDLLKAPIRMVKSSDQLEYQGSIVDLFTSLGYILLQTEDKEVKLQILDIVLRILVTKRVGDSDMVPLNPCVKALEISEFTECLADFIAISEKDLYSMAIFTALHICQMSKLCCWTLLMKEVVESILVRLTLVYTEEVADSMYQLLWELFNCTDRREDWERTPQPSRIALRSLRYVLREQVLVHAHPGRDSEVLHNIAAITLKIIHLYPEADFVLSGLTEDITVSATLSESVLEIHMTPFFKNKSHHLRFKKIMLACLAASPINSLSVEIFERYKLAECLVTMLRLDPSRRKPSWLSISTLETVSMFSSQDSSSTLFSEVPWFSFEPEQSFSLFRSVLPVVCAVFDFLHQRFIKADLINTLMSFLDIYYLQEKKDLDDMFNAVIKTIFFICFNEKNPNLVRTALLKSPTVHILLESCSLFLNNSGSFLTTQEQSILSHMLLILATLMEGQTYLQIYSANKSFQVVQSLYHRIIKPFPSDSIIDNKLIVAVSNFAWVVLTSEEQNLLKFIDSGELYNHLDILERSNFPTQLVYLSMLVDVAEHRRSVPYLVSWRGKNGVKLLSLLCTIWRNEEYSIKVPRSEKGCITDIERPLMGEDQFRISKENQDSYLSSCDTLGSCRPKICALIQLLHRHEEVVKLCEEHYRIGYDVLPWADQVTLQLIEAYLPLKLGEVWWEIFSKQQEVLPLDRYLAQTLADRYLNWSLCVQKAQNAIIYQQETALRMEEKQYYSQVKSVRLTSALEALRHVVAIARSADRQVLLSTQERLREGIEASRPFFARDIDLHIAFPRDVGMVIVNPDSIIVQRSGPD